jgi:hypothetical protein
MIYRLLEQPENANATEQRRTTDKKVCTVACKHLTTHSLGLEYTEFCLKHLAGTSRLFDVMGRVANERVVPPMGCPTTPNDIDWEVRFERCQTL